jgi:hypothetical protein
VSGEKVLADSDWPRHRPRDHSVYSFILWLIVFRAPLCEIGKVHPPAFKVYRLNAQPCAVGEIARLTNMQTRKTIRCICHDLGSNKG